MKNSSRLSLVLRTIPVALALSAATSAFAQTPAASCEKADEKQIAGLFDRWNASLKTGDADRVTANYAPNGVLLATVANEPLSTPADIRGYFVKFLEGKPQGTINKRFVTVGCNTAKDVGTYTFAFKDGTQVSARYTYVYEFTGGQWKIIHHHSSAMPNKV
jgi:uncharacterized protein (TIGR02246 family)